MAVYSALRVEEEGGWGQAPTPLFEGAYEENQFASFVGMSKQEKQFAVVYVCVEETGCCEVEQEQQENEPLCCLY